MVYYIYLLAWLFSFFGKNDFKIMEKVLFFRALALKLFFMWFKL